MSYYIGQPDGKKIVRRSFKTLDGALRARFDLLDSTGLKILRETDEGIEVYVGKENGRPQFMAVKDGAKP